MTARDEWRWTDERGVQRLVRTEELRAALANKVLPPTTLVWRPGLPEWVPASAMPELAGGSKLPIDELSTVTGVILSAPAAGPDQAPSQVNLDPQKRRASTRTLTGLAAPTTAAEQSRPHGPNVPIVVPAAGGTPEAVRRGLAITRPPTYGSPSLSPETMPDVPGGARARAPITARGPMGARPAGEGEPTPARISMSPNLWPTEPSEEDETTFVADGDDAGQHPALPPRPQGVPEERPAATEKSASAARPAAATATGKGAAAKAASPEALVGGFPALIPRKEASRSVTPSGPPRPGQASPKPAVPRPPKPEEPVSRRPAKAEQTSTEIMAASSQEPPRQAGGSEAAATRNLVPRPPPSARFSMRLPPAPVPSVPAAAEPQAQGDKSAGGPARAAVAREERTVLMTVPGASAPQAASPKAPQVEAPAAREAVNGQAPQAVSTALQTKASPAAREQPGAGGASPAVEGGRLNEPYRATPTTPFPPFAASSDGPAAPPPDASPARASVAPVERSTGVAGSNPPPAPPEALRLPPHVSPRFGAGAAFPPRASASVSNAPGLEPELGAGPYGAGRPSLRELRGPVQVPLTSILGAGAALIGMVVTAFVVGRCSVDGRGNARSSDPARPALFAAPLLARAVTPPPLKPCWVARQPVMWAPRVSKSVPFDVVATSAGTFALGYARGETEAAGIEINVESGEVHERFSNETEDPIERVTPSPGGSGFLVTTEADGGAIRPIVYVPDAPPFVIGLGGSSVTLANDQNGPATPLWPMQGEGEPGAARAQLAGDQGYAVIFRRGDAIWGGWIGRDRRPSGALTQVTGSGGAVGKPMSGWNGREIAVVFADRPSDDARYEIRVGRAPAGSIPTSTTVIPLPKGGPGGDAFAPGIAGLADGRWVLVWTEGSPGNRAIRAQTLAPDLKPLGDPIALSPPAGNFGQGVPGVAAGYVTVVFLSQGKVSYELWGAMLQCG